MRYPKIAPGKFYVDCRCWLMFCTSIEKEYKKDNILYDIDIFGYPVFNNEPPGMCSLHHCGVEILYQQEVPIALCCARENNGEYISYTALKNTNDYYRDAKKYGIQFVDKQYKKYGMEKIKDLDDETIKSSITFFSNCISVIDKLLTWTDRFGKLHYLSWAKSYKDMAELRLLFFRKIKEERKL